MEVDTGDSSCYTWNNNDYVVECESNIGFILYRTLFFDYGKCGLVYIKSCKGY